MPTANCALKSFTSTSAIILLLLASNACVRKYKAEGLVLAASSGALTVSHKEIPGRMPAMVMTLPLARPSTAPWKPGDRIRFELQQSRRGSTIANIERLPDSRQFPQDAAGQTLLRVPAPSTALSIGDAVPDAILTDQLGSERSIRGLQGRWLAVQFLYTRCPLPEVCPRLSSHFALVQKRLAVRMPADLMLLSVTIDPLHDTPEVLRDYARRWRAQQQNWLFLRAAEEETRRFAALFGLVYWPEEGAITHSSVTAILSPTGHLAALVDGSSYDGHQLADLIEYLMEGGM